MNIVISNLTNRLTVINLNSGRTVILGPREKSEKIPGTETRDNRMIEKMEDARVIKVQGEDQGPAKLAKNRKADRVEKRH